jgi:hypothetical protein
LCTFEGGVDALICGLRTLMAEISVKFPENSVMSPWADAGKIEISQKFLLDLVLLLAPQESRVLSKKFAAKIPRKENETEISAPPGAENSPTVEISPEMIPKITQEKSLNIPVVPEIPWQTTYYQQLFGEISRSPHFIEK